MSYIKSVSKWHNPNVDNWLSAHYLCPWSLMTKDWWGQYFIHPSKVVQDAGPESWHFQCPDLCGQGTHLTCILMSLCSPSLLLSLFIALF